MAERLWTLKILSGVHLGAEVTLVEEEAVLGRDEDCDFVLEDDGLASRHLSLLAAESGVRLTVLDAGGPVRIDGQPVSGTTRLQPFQVVSIGGLAFAVGPAGQTWPAIELPPAQADDDAPEPEAVATDSDAPAGQEGDEGEYTQARDEHADQASGRRQRPIAAAAAIGAAALLAVAGGLWLLAPKAPEPKRADPADAVREIKEIASQHGAVVQVRAGGSADAPVSVTGHIGTDRDLGRFLDGLAGTGIRAAVHLVSSDQLVEAVNAILEQSLNRDRRNKVEVTPVSQAPGELVISGYVHRASSLEEAQALLARDLKGSKGLKYEIETKADRLAVLRQRLEGLKLGGSMRIQQLDDGIGLFGPVDSDEELARIRKLVDDFNAEFDSRPRLKLEGTDAFLGVSTIDFDVRAVVLGQHIHVIAQDGAHYEKGSRIPGGYVIRTITEHYMILEKPVAVGQFEQTEAPGLAYVIFDGA